MVVKLQQSWAGLRIHVTLMRIRIQLFALLRIRILLLIKVCDNWSMEPPGLRFEPLGLHGVHCPLRHCFETLRLPDFNFTADPESKNYADPCGSGYATLVWSWVKSYRLPTQGNRLNLHST
jgi:hypothetical protein